MAEQRINSGANFVFPVGVVPAGAQLDNRHNVIGNVTYQIGAAPAVVIPMVPDQDYSVPGVNGQLFAVTNGLPNSLYVVY
ncbi:MAG: hypothetical protein ABW360_16310 [Phenylobacterium sp.]